MKNEKVNHPAHYAGKVECIEAIESCMSEEAFKGFLRGNIIKYLWRAGKKDSEIQEFKKAQWYLDRLIEMENAKRKNIK